MNLLNIPDNEAEVLVNAARILAKHTGQGNLELLERFKQMIANQAMINRANVDRSQAQEQRETFAAHAGAMIAADLARDDKRTLEKLLTTLVKANQLNHILGLSGLDIQFIARDEPEQFRTSYLT